MMDGAPPPYTYEWWKVIGAMISGLVGGIVAGTIAWFSLNTRVSTIEKALAADIEARAKERKEAAEALAVYRAERARQEEVQRYEPRPYCLTQQAALKAEFAAIATSAIKDGLNNLLLQNHEKFSEVKMDIALIKQNQETFKERQAEHYLKMDTVYSQLMECESCDRRTNDDAEYVEPSYRRRKSDNA
jgi:hypothetical protein